jgi:hypothetical protein
MKAIMIVILTSFVGSPAYASLHPRPQDYLSAQFVDAAAKPAYPEIAPVGRRFHHWHHHSSAHALRRSRSRRFVRSRHVDRKPPRRAEEAAHRPILSPTKPLRDALALAAGALVGLAEGFEDGITTSLPVLAHGPSRLRGTLEVAGIRVPYGSGGAGYALDYGDYRITPDDVGSWGARHGAIGLAHDEIWDARLHRYREGIEIHAAMNDRLITEGCVAIARRQWQGVKRAILAMIDESGRAFLHIDPSGARIEPDPNPVVMLANSEPRIKERRVEHRHVVMHHRRWRHRHYASR